MQPAVELVGGEEAAFIEQFVQAGQISGSDGLAGTITAKDQQAARSGMLEHQVRRLGRFREPESFEEVSEVGETSLLFQGRSLSRLGSLPPRSQTGVWERGAGAARLSRSAEFGLLARATEAAARG